jgi:predicted DNA-binding transcriptional regulator AlpA
MSTTIQSTSQSDLRVLRFEEVALQLGWSSKHLERIVQKGEGPQVTKLSPKNRGIRADHLRAWLDKKSEPAQAALKAPEAA